MGSSSRPAVGEEIPFDLARFLENCLAARAGADPVPAIAALVRAAVAGPDGLRRAFPESDADPDEQVVHACANLTVLLVRLTPGLEYPPHDHGMPAVIGAYEGAEVNRYWRPAGGGLVPVTTRLLGIGEVEQMGPSVIHSVANPGRSRSCGLHVYLGDLFGRPRHLWDPITHERLQYSEESYFSRARAFEPGETWMADVGGASVLGRPTAGAL